MINKSIIDTIGPKTFVDFPELSLFKVPAKVDTGADSSSVWASNISEEKGQLKFTLFDEDSPFYSGDVIATKRYRLITIRNSFGIAEPRFRVSLQIKLEGRLIRATFTLADRSSVSYSVLIGARALRGKFLVDVSKSDNSRSSQ